MTNPRDPETRRLPRPGGPDAPTEQIRARRPDAAPTERIRRPVPPSSLPLPPPSPPALRDNRGGRGLFTRRTSRLLAVIAVAALAGGLAGAELYARHRADAVLVGIAECVVEDGTTISYGVNPPFLWQHITGRYTNISVRTAGDRVQSADGMTADVTLEDVRLSGSGDSKGTIGALHATLTWTAAGIKDTVAANLPGVGALVTDVTTDPSAGTLEMAAGSASVIAKPVVVEGNLNLEVLDVTGPFPKDAVQSALDDLTRKLNDNYPLGIRADSVEVTDAAVVGSFSSRDASIPDGESDPCFARL
ncbi:DUF2993 domain-containing protein [Mycolicibacterium sp. PAM1]|uniref:DUF2993 domain-containing protein n=1 Tax=Mycolicibacterium gilvum (strain PYR-GCK) TaxID=350054 RepID=A4TDG9_MYCGI|nr:DUF2993 domain-containing protein [Mycolicibacterium sp. PAM1]ABP46904.1 conserved hypothetical protein [Mycolicibacterium gilvum PYR-GCK]MBV5244991.1 DUF2993 domain-containing protein [Mycolicibacterium sp. PAM1]